MTPAAPRLEARMLAWMRRFGMAAAGERVAVAVSGGSDSVALLLLLHSLAGEEGWQLGVAHYNHGWRREAEAEAGFVRDLAERLELPFWLGSAEPGGGERNREQAARRARYAFFQTLIARGEAMRVATGHTADDQAETVLLRLLRGAGTAGLAGILPARACTETAKAGATVIRPMLGIARGELRAWLQARGQTWCEDQSNMNLAYGRNRMRHETLPALEAGTPGLARRLGTLAEVARAEEEFWTGYLPPLWRRLWQPTAGGGWRAVRGELQELPLAVRRRVLREAIRRARGDLRQVDFADIEELVEWLGDGVLHPRRRRLARVECRLSAHYLELAR